MLIQSGAEPRDMFDFLPSLPWSWLKREQARRWSGLLSFLYWVTVVLAGAFGAATNLPEQETSFILADLAEGVRQNAWWASPTSVGLALILGLVRRRVGSPSVWEAVHEGLEAVRNQAFADRSTGDPEHYHRATLFRYYSVRPSWRYWPWTRRLVAVARSGRHTRKAITTFRAPDTPDRTNGVAGQAWARPDSYRVPELPDVSGDPSPAEVERYARLSSVTKEWVRENQPETRSLFGMRLEVDGEPWGVLVLDSRDPEPIEGEKAFRMVARTLTPLLKGV